MIFDLFSTEKDQRSRSCIAFLVIFLCAPVAEVELGDAPAAHAVDGELAESLHQLALPLPTEEDALLVDDAHLKMEEGEGKGNE